MAGMPVTNTNSSGTANRSPTFTLPVSPIENDIIFVLSARPNPSSAITAGGPPTGWVNTLDNSPTSTAVLDPGDGSCFGAFVYHVVTAAEDAADTVTWTLTNLWAANGDHSNVVAVYRGIDTSAPIDGIGTTGDVGGAATPHVLAAIASGDISASNETILRFVAADGSRTWTTPAGHTAIDANSATSGAWVGSRDTNTTSGVAVDAVNITPSSGDEYYSASLALVDAATGEDKSTTGTIALATSATGAAAKAGLSAGAIGLGLAVGDDIAKTGDTDGTIATALATIGDAVKTGVTSGAATLTLVAAGAVVKAADVAAAISLILDTTGTVSAVEGPAINGTLALALVLTGDIGKAGDTNATIATTLELSGTATKHAATTGILALTLAVAGTAQAGSEQGVVLAIITALTMPAATTTIAAPSADTTVNTATALTTIGGTP